VRKRHPWRVAFGALFAIFATAQVARTAVVDLNGASADVQEALWPRHPAVLSAGIMGDVGQAAARGGEPDERTLARLEQLAAKKPLGAQPFLVQGAIAARNGDYERAERLLANARQRAPRSPAARYLMGDLYLRSNRPVEAMAEMAVLNRLLPAGSQQLAPSLAAYARSPGSIPQIKAILASYPELEEPLLTTMSTDVANTDAILKLASPPKREGPAPIWQRLLLSNLVDKGEYAKAYSSWSRLSGVATRPGLHNPQFDASNAPPPFNWRLAEGAGAVVQPSSGGLQVVYYGRDNLALAEQVTLLPAGRYRLAASVSGSFPQGSGVAWRVKCLPAGPELLSLPVARPGPLGGEFTVPAGCAAQNVSLSGEMLEVPGASDFRVSGLRLSRVMGR
jgi:hypothetical protein